MTILRVRPVAAGLAVLSVLLGVGAPTLAQASVRTAHPTASSSYYPAPEVNIQQVGGSLAVVLEMRYGAPGRLVRVYVQRGSTPPGRPHHVPKGRPIYQCVQTSCPDGHVIRLHHVPSLGIYSVSAYGTTGKTTARSTYVEQRIRRGVYVGNDDRIDSHRNIALGLQVDRTGTEHAVSASSYLTRAAGAMHWTRTSITGSDESRGMRSFQVSASGLSTDGTRVFFVFDRCGAVFVTQASVRAHRLPAASRAHRQGTLCGNPEFGTGFNGAVSLPHHRVGLLVGNDFVAGRPGGTWTSQALPGSSDYQAYTITRDRGTGEILVLGVSKGGGGAVVWSHPSGHGWLAPRAITLPAKALPSSGSIAADRGHAWIAFDGDAPSGLGQQILLLHRGRSGHWSSPHWLYRPSTTSQVSPLLAYNAGSHHLHLVYTRYVDLHHEGVYDNTTGVGINPRSGLEQQRLVGGRWTSRRQLSHCYRDQIEAVTFTPSGQLIPLLTRAAD